MILGVKLMVSQGTLRTRIGHPESRVLPVGWIIIFKFAFSN